MFVKVAINIPSDKTFTYAVPKAFEIDIATGKRVFVPLEKRRVTGYIIEVMAASTCENIKEIIDIIDIEPLFNEDDLRFYQWVSQYYIYPLGKTLSEILPGGIDLKSNRWITPSQGIGNSNTIKSIFHMKIMNIFNDFPNGLSLNRIKNVLGKKDIYRDIKALQSMGLIHVQDIIKKPVVALKKEKVATVCSGDTSSAKLTKNQMKLIDFLRVHGRTSFTTLRKTFTNLHALAKSLEKKGLLHISEEDKYRSPCRPQDIGNDEGIIIPNEEQKIAFLEIVKGIDSQVFSPYLLHGVTGSGKTEVYLNAIEEVLRQMGGAIFLVPEISLTPQLLTRLYGRFHDQEIAVLHSGISKSVRYDQWRRIQKGEINIVVGARSALFAPVRNLKLIIVDEEHDTSYKQDDRIRYNARDLAVMRAKLLSATVVLGSATPAIQTYFNTMKGKYTYLILSERVKGRPMPEIAIVDMKQEKERANVASFPILSRILKSTIQDTLEKEKQVLLFLNRRGFHTFVFCPDCGYVFKCLNCAVSMTHHANAGILKCHHCDYIVGMPPCCPECLSNRIMQHGVGTERLEKEIKRIFPCARVGRMDSDTTTVKGSYVKILQSLDRHEIDILVGTQMITKGHDFHNITLVGIISADTSLNRPDFRSAERTFQILTQASGRGGRGDFPGKVIIQTFNPQHYAIIKAKNHDYMGFYREELSVRKELSYPPYSRIVNLHLSGTRHISAQGGIEKLKNLARELIKTDKYEGGKVDIIGPAEAPIFKMKGRYRWQLLLKGKDTHALNHLCHDILSKAAGIGLDIKVDVDPINFM
jgi:primosomal protein N' (replication factor Y) (superfamily II helicase)